MTINQSIDKGFALLELLDTAADGIGVREMARQLELHPSNVQRLVNTLSQLGYVEPVPNSKRYRLSFKTYFLGSSLLSQDRLTSTAMVELDRLANEHEVSAYLSILQDRAAAYLLAVQGRGLVSVRVTPGATTGLHSSAMGKVLLMDRREDEIRQLVGADPLPASTRNTITTTDKLLREIETAKEAGYTVSLEETYDGIISIGAPIKDFRGVIVAAISVALPLPSDLTGRVAFLAPHLIRAAQAISRGIGCPEAFLGPPGREASSQSA